MKLDQVTLDFIAKEITSPELRAEREEAYERYLMYHGKSLEIIKKAFRKEFKRPETVNELDLRITPLNITQKIINSLSQVYLESPLRYPVDGSEQDQELINLYEDEIQLNRVMKSANRSVNQHKCALLEIFIDETGTPGIRDVPRHSYEVFSLNSIRPNKPDVYCKILRDATDPADMVIAIYTDESHFIINGKGQTIPREMMRINNPDGVNPYGVAPFYFINTSDDTVRPPQDDDLKTMAIVIPILLSDMNFAMKYQAFSVISVIGSETDIPFSPNSVISMPFGPNGERPSIEAVKPTIDVDKMISHVTNLIVMILSSKSISPGAIKSMLNLSNAVSGISKAIDNKDEIEDKQDQQQNFLIAEYRVWELLAKYMIPYWRQNNLIKAELNREFTPAFEIGVIFREPKLLMSPKDTVEIEKLKLDAGLTTLKRALGELNKEMSGEEIDILEQEIKQEKVSSLLNMVEVNGEKRMEAGGQVQDRSGEDIQ